METVITSGCTSGLGLAIHNVLCQHKVKNIFVGRRLERLQQQNSQSYFEVDFTQTNDWQQLTSLIDEDCQTLTLISNAAIVTPVDQVANLDNQLFQDSCSVNFIEPCRLVSVLLKWSRQRQIPCRIVNISSGAAHNPIAGWSSYCATKSAFRMFLDVAAIESDLTEIIHFDPGVMDTQMQADIRQATPSEMQNVRTFQELKEEGRLQDPNEVARDLVDRLWG